MNCVKPLGQWVCLSEGKNLRTKRYFKWSLYTKQSVQKFTKLKHVNRRNNVYFKKNSLPYTIVIKKWQTLIKDVLCFVITRTYKLKIQHTRWYQVIKNHYV